MEVLLYINFTRNHIVEVFDVLKNYYFLRNKKVENKSTNKSIIIPTLISLEMLLSKYSTEKLFVLKNCYYYYYLFVFLNVYNTEKNNFEFQYT